MNLRFPEVFGLVLLVAFLCSFALPRGMSHRVENSFQFLFAPITGPIQWMSGKGETERADVPILPQSSDEVTRLRAEKAALQSYVEILRGQMETLAHRETEAGRIGGELSGKVTTVKVIAADANGRDVLRLAGTSAGSVEADQAVVTSSGLVGRVQEVALLGNQSSVRLITDKGFKLIGRFGRYQNVGDGTVQLAMLPLEPTVLVGIGNGAMRIDGLRTDDVRAAGLARGDHVFLSDPTSSAWPIEIHGTRVGLVEKVGEKLDTPGVAEIIVRPEADLLTLKDVWVVTRK